MFEKSFDPQDKAHTLHDSTVSAEYTPPTDIELSRTHPDGWTISGIVRTDGHYFWVNNFQASHPVHGRVWGNFEKTVHADTEAGFTAFCAAYPVEVWDYDDV